MATSLEFVPADIYGSQTTGGVAEEAMTLQLNGAVAAASIAVPVGERWEISTLQFTAAPAARRLWRSFRPRAHCAGHGRGVGVDPDAGPDAWRCGAL
jgi:hypothetical protein